MTKLKSMKTIKKILLSYVVSHCGNSYLRFQLENASHSLLQCDAGWGVVSGCSPQACSPIWQFFVFIIFLLQVQILKLIILLSLTDVLFISPSEDSLILLHYVPTLSLTHNLISFFFNFLIYFNWRLITVLYWLCHTST